MTGLTRLPAGAPVAFACDGKGHRQEEAGVRVMAEPGEYAGRVIGQQDLAALLAPFGMIVTVDPDEDMAMQTAQMANALVGAVEAHASRAEDAYRQQGADPAGLVQVGLMAFAGVPCPRDRPMTWRSSSGGPSPWRARSARWTSPARSSARATSDRVTH